MLVSFGVVQRLCVLRKTARNIFNSRYSNYIACTASAIKTVCIRTKARHPCERNLSNVAKSNCSFTTKRTHAD